MLEVGREENNNCVEIVSNSQQQNSQKQQQKFPVLDVNQLQYSDKYFDDKFEYRHIILPKEFSRYVPRTHLMTETEWRNLGIQQSPGWVHYLLHAPEPHVLMFRRLIQTVEKHQALLCTEEDSEDEEGEDLEEIEELEASDVTEMELDPDDEDYEEGEEYRGCC